MVTPSTPPAPFPVQPAAPVQRKEPSEMDFEELVFSFGNALDNLDAALAAH